MNKQRRLEILSIEDVNNRLPLVKRIVRDIRSVHRERKVSERRFSYFRTCLRKVRSREVEETVDKIRGELGSLDRDLEELRREITALGGILKDSERGWVDFFSEKESRLIFLCWRPGEREVLFWHEIDKDHSDEDLSRYPLRRGRAL
jgi:hypothetical protein